MNVNEKENFTPFKIRETHWGEPAFRPIMQNVATVLPPDLPEQFLHLLMLRMQQEEAQYKFNHIEDEAEFVVWRENTLDLTTWSGKAHEAAKSRAKELLSEEMKSIQSEIDEIFPIVLPPPPPRSQE